MIKRKTIKLSENNLHRLIKESVKTILRESDWNLHYSHRGEHNLKPYGSDSKFMMIGRETGHFGSGTYFSTYKGSKERAKYIDNATNFDPHFIQVADHVYRVDFDLYKNMYRVRSKNQGDVLYTLLRNVNVLYNHICADLLYDKGFNPKKADYNTSKQYQIIKANANALNLKCPSYMELIRMAQNHQGNQSFSTVFMEWNGYNGVNVSGIDFYDNTTHGSVIYDLSKTNTNMEEVKPKNTWPYRHYSYDKTLIYNPFEDLAMKALDGNLFNEDIKKLSSLPLPQAMRVLKNFTQSGNVIPDYCLDFLSDDLIKKYLYMLFVKKPTDSWGNPLCDKVFSRRYRKVILDNGLYYWVNYISRNDSMLTALLNAFDFELDWSLSAEEEYQKKKAFFDKLMTYLKRDLTKDEEEDIQDYFSTD